MTKVYLYIIDHDPGHERIKQAFKTVLSVAVSVLLIFWWVPGAGTLLAGFCAGTLSLCHEGESRHQRMISMLIAGMTAIAAVWLGTILTHQLLLFNLIFIAACFVAFYVREKCGPRYLSFPIFSLLLLMVAFIAPYEHSIFIYPIVALTGFLAAFIVNFYLLPVNMDLQFKHNFKVFLYKYDSIISLLSIGVEKAESGEYYHSKISRIDSLIEKIKNERMLSKGMPLNINTQKDMEKNIINQYELFKLLSMLNESLFFLSEEKIDRKIRTMINAVFKELSNAVDALIECYSGKTKTVSFDKLKDSLSGFKSDVYNMLSETDSDAGVHLSNLVFGIQRTYKLLVQQSRFVEKEEEI